VKNENKRGNSNAIKIYSRFYNGASMQSAEVTELRKTIQDLTEALDLAWDTDISRRGVLYESVRGIFSKIFLWGKFVLIHSVIFGFFFVALIEIESQLPISDLLFICVLGGSISNLSFLTGHREGLYEIRRALSGICKEKYPNLFRTSA